MVDQRTNRCGYCGAAAQKNTTPDRRPGLLLGRKLSRPESVADVRRSTATSTDRVSSNSLNTPPGVSRRRGQRRTATAAPFAAGDHRRRGAPE